MSKVLFIGLGNMGAPMAMRLAAAGHDIAVQDINDARVAELSAAEERVFPASDEDRASADVVITMLPTSAIVEGVLETSGLAEALSPDTLIIDMSSAEPTRSRALARRLADRQLRYLDAPVSGGVRGAEAGTLAIMVGGTEADLLEATPLLRTMGASLVHVGEHGAGHAAKALNNMVSAASVVATVEAIHAAQAFGIAPEKFVDVLNQSSGRSVTSEQKARQFMLSGSFDSGFPIGLMSKDVSIAVDLATQQRSEIALGAHVSRMWAAVAADHATADHTRMYELLGRTVAEATKGTR